MLQRVTPVDRGTPHAKNIFITNVKATNCTSAFVAGGYEKSLLENFVFTNCVITATQLGTLEYTKGWKWNNTSLDISIKKAQEPSGKVGVEQKERLKN